MKGKIVLIPFPFTNITSTKLRPALVLYEAEKDVVVAFISSRIQKVKTIDIIINEKNVEFNQTGLKLCSTIKLDKIATISKELIVGEIGEIRPKLRELCNKQNQQTLNKEGPDYNFCWFS